jgi:hypothetical protein
MIALSEEKISIKEFNDLFNNPLIGKSKWKTRASGLYKVETIY